MNFEATTNKTLNITTMQLEENFRPEPLFVRGTKSQEKYVVRNIPHAGRGCVYPWKDPEYAVGDWFWKPVSYSQWMEGKARPNAPTSDSMGNRKWITSKSYREDTKQYGYFVKRIA
tara:strand:- start:53 stop:400 length:348 start_codon:yes stop_codon:yes gene_type:complete